MIRQFPTKGLLEKHCSNKIAITVILAWPSHFISHVISYTHTLMRYLLDSRFLLDCRIIRIDFVKRDNLVWNRRCKHASVRVSRFSPVFPQKTTSLREATKFSNFRFIDRLWIHARHHRAINKNSRGFSTPRSELTFAYYSRERLAHGIITTLMIITCGRWISRRIPAFPCPSASEHRQSRAAAIMHVITDNLLRFHRDRRTSTRCCLRMPLVKALGITADNNCIPRRWWAIKEISSRNSLSHLVSTFARSN